jgi:hypothetical protein
MLALLLVPAAAGAMIPRDAAPFNYANNPATATPAVHQVATDAKNSDNTLPIALGAIALGVSLIGIGYVTYRSRPMPAARS